MSKNEQFKYEVISDFLTAKISRQTAAQMLEVRQRTVTRMARRVEAKSMAGVVHGNRGLRAHNRVDDLLKKKVMNLMNSTYFDFNMTHALEMLKSEHGLVVSYSTFRGWCDEKHLVKRRKRRRGKARKARVRCPSEGMILQMDGSPHRYNRKDEWCLIATIDDASSDIPYAEFFHSEDTLSCMTVMQKTIELKGIPMVVYTDKAGIFGGQKRQEFSQFKRACGELGIKLIFADSPQAKGRIERAWDTVQDRIIPEMRLRKIHRMPVANSYLQEQFLPNYWRINNVVKPLSKSKFKKLPKHINLNEIFCIKEYRSVKNDHTISWGSQIYKLESPVKYSIQGQKIEIRTYQDLTWKAYFAGKPIEIVKFERQAPIKFFNTKPKLKKAG